MVEGEPKRPVPANLPKGRPLPTLERARQAVREGNEMIKRLLEEARKKAPGADEEFHTAVIPI